MTGAVKDFAAKRGLEVHVLLKQLLEAVRTEEAMVARDGFTELPTIDQERMKTRSAMHHGIKQAVEFAGLRKQRFTLHHTGDKPGDATQGKSPSTGTKRIYLLRHGEGEHNAWRAAEFAAGRTPNAKRHNVGAWPAELHDPCLTAKGRADASAAAASARALPRPSLLVTSPMRRAVQTMDIAFSDALAAGVPAVAFPSARPTSPRAQAPLLHGPGVGEAARRAWWRGCCRRRR